MRYDVVALLWADALLRRVCRMPACYGAVRPFMEAGRTGARAGAFEASARARRSYGFVTGRLGR